MHSRAKMCTETEYRVCGFLHFRIESIESFWIEFHRVRIYLSVVEPVPDIGKDSCSFWEIVLLINVVLAKSVREAFMLKGLV